MSVLWKKMRIIDSHCHLDDKSYNKDIDVVIKRADESDVKAALIAGISKKTCERAIALTTRFPNLYAAVGIHPHDVKSCSDSIIKDLIRFTDHPKVKAWGETGLDYNRMYSFRDIQEKWFIKQLEVAYDVNLPLIFHERDSEGRFLELLKQHHKKDRQAVVHCFSGNKEELMEYLNLGFYIGITGIITIRERGKDLREFVPFIPNDRILVETDAPYLTPAPYKNKTRRNEPAFVKSVLLKVAEIKGEEPEKFSEVIWENTCKLFKLKL